MRNRALIKVSKRMSIFKAIAFDYSGLLVNDLFFTLEVVNDVFRKFLLPQINLPELQQEFRLPFYTIFVRRGIPQQAAIESSLKIYRDTYPAYKNAMHPFEDAVNCIRTLDELDIKLAIVSQTPRQQLQYQLERFGLLDYFESVLTLGELPRDKPDPLPLLETARRLDVRPEEMLFVGDMYEDVECARRAGAQSVAVDRSAGSYHTRGRLLEAMPDFVAPNLTELANVLTLKQEVAA